MQVNNEMREKAKLTGTQLATLKQEEQAKADAVIKQQEVKEKEAGKAQKIAAK